MQNLDEIERVQAQVRLGRNIQRLRNLKSLTLAQLAGDSGMPPSHLQRIEAGEIDPDLLPIFRIAQRLEVTLSEIFAGVCNEQQGEDVQ